MAERAQHADGRQPQSPAPITATHSSGGIGLSFDTAEYVDKPEHDNVAAHTGSTPLASTR